MIRQFDLGVILTFITGRNLVDKFGKCHELAWFIYDDEFINDTGLLLLKNEIKEHLLFIHPQLKEIKYNTTGFNGSAELWLEVKKLEYGESLPVSKIGYNLDGIARKR